MPPPCGPLSPYPGEDDGEFLVPPLAEKVSDER